MPVDDVTESDRVAHKGLVIGAIVESVSTLETEAWEILHYGPGNFLGSDRTDQAAKAILNPLATLIDRQEILSRYETILHLLGKQAMNRGHQPWQDASLVVGLRNEVVHYKSKWGQELGRAKLIRGLKGKQLTPPPFLSGGSAFFPHLCLSASCANWAVDSVIGFIDEFYSRLGIQSPADSVRHHVGGAPSS